MKTKGTKGAIIFLRSHFKIGIYSQKAEDIIAILKQGEKYRQMWEELQKNFGREPIELHDLNEFMDDYKQKYFPKASQDYKEGEE